MAKNLSLFKAEEESIELDMAPLLSLIVSLIPILIFTVVMVKVGVVETQLPQVVNDAIELERKNPTPEVSIMASVLAGKGIELEIIHNGQSEKRSIPLIDNEFDYDGFHKELVRAKEQYPQTFRLDLRPDLATPYNKIIKIMDAARKTKVGERKIFVIDKGTNQKVETDIMFVDIFFGNVMEG
ncbi:MAG: biopolymer transporter ExbD [Pseudomonadota bacterium]|nr:biopolymer transporter ExbD [Pseudomonadota bacterium]